MPHRKLKSTVVYLGAGSISLNALSLSAVTATFITFLFKNQDIGYSSGIQHGTIAINGQIVKMLFIKQTLREIIMPPQTS